jgi:hypothetical protein
MCDTTGKLRDGENEGEIYKRAGGIHACKHSVGTEDAGRRWGEDESRSDQRKSRIIEDGEVRSRKMHSRRYEKGERREGGRDHLHGLRVRRLFFTLFSIFVLTYFPLKTQ